MSLRRIALVRPAALLLRPASSTSRLPLLQRRHASDTPSAAPKEGSEEAPPGTIPMPKDFNELWNTYLKHQDPDKGIAPSSNHHVEYMPVPDEIPNPEINDPLMNGGYVNGILQKRSDRDPYGEWWDEQGRRNYGEPLHEDDDILGVFSTTEYRHFTPGWGVVLVGSFVATVFGLMAAVYQVYPDKPSVPRTFPGGLVEELGGPRTARARMDGAGEDTYA